MNRKVKKASELRISHLSADIGDKAILHSVSLRVRGSEVHAIMGPNGSGKSTFASVLMGHPGYTVAKKGHIMLDGVNVLDKPTEKRAKAGLFLAFQSPIAIAGVTTMNLLRTAFVDDTRTKKKSDTKIQNPILAKRSSVGGMPIAEFMTMVSAYAAQLNLDESLLRRGIHDGFSGGEKKKIEMLQALVLHPKFAIFDEIDTGLDVDALKAVSTGIELLRRQGVGIIIITHYQRILKYVKPDFVHILSNGVFVDHGDSKLAKYIEEHGYTKYVRSAPRSKAK